MFHHSVDEEMIDDPGGLEDWERELEEEEEEERARREREKPNNYFLEKPSDDFLEKPRNELPAKKTEAAERCPHCFM